MQPLDKPRSRWLKAVASFLLLTAIFAVSYTQSPLYTSNQNQYFLHGAAQAGLGYLHEDWLATTLDPTPVFSELAFLTYRFFKLDAIFYLYYALLMGIYITSLLGIVASVFDIRSSPLRYLLVLALIIAVHSAAWRFFASRALGVNWTYILEDGVADQRLLGSVFEPSTFGVLLVLSIYLFLRGQRYLAVLSATLAATVHPTYLLSAAALTLAYLWVVLQENWTPYRLKRKTEGPSWNNLASLLRQPVLLGLFALVTVSPILVYTYANFGHTPPATTAQAQAILVDYRIPHHALVSWWLDATAVLKILFVAVALFLIRKSRLFPILLIPSLVAAGLTLVQVLTRSDYLALIFPWRLSTWIVPLCVALLLAFGVVRLFARYPDLADRYPRLLAGIGVVILSLAVIVGAIRFKLDLDRKANEDDTRMMAYVAAHHAPGETYLTPVKLQDFRLATGSPVYVDFKSIPYRDSDVLEWYRRNQLTNRFYKKIDCNLLASLETEAHITDVVLESDDFGRACPALQLMYHDKHYGVYAFK